MRRTDDWQQVSDLPDKIRIGDITLDRQLHQIHRQDDVQSIEPRLVRLLEELCLAAGAPVSRERLLEAVSSLPYAGDEALTQAISKARRILCDDTRDPRYIRTIPRKGYALVAPVSSWAGAPSVAPKMRGPLRSRWFFAAFVLFLPAGLYLLSTFREVEIEFTSDGEREFFEKQDLEEDREFREKEAG